MRQQLPRRWLGVLVDELRVNAGELSAQGTGLTEAANSIPAPPAPFVSTGTDALSVALAGKLEALEAPLIAGMPVTKAESVATAQNVIKAAAMYEQTDQQIADMIRAALARLEDVDSGSGVSRGGGAAAASAGATTAGEMALAGGAAQHAGQFGQMMGMPMQMAGQAGQSLGQVPQMAMRAAQSGEQQASGMAGQAGESGGRDETELVKADERREEPVEPQGATAGDSSTERAPASPPPVEAAPERSESGPAPDDAPPSRPSDPQILL